MLVGTELLTSLRQIVQVTILRGRDESKAKARQRRTKIRR